MAVFLVVDRTWLDPRRRDDRGDSVPGAVELEADVAAVQNERFMNVWEGTSQNQWSNTPNSRAMPLSTGTCSGV